MIAQPLAVLALALTAHAQQPPASTGYIIAGTVIDHATKQPLGGIGVMLNTSQSPDQGRRPRVSLSVVTSDDGRFNFTNLPPGKYALTAQRRTGQPEGYQNYQGFFTGLVVGPDADTTHVVFPLQSPARLLGKVTDDSGEPVPRASVVLFLKDVSNGKLQVQQAGQVNTTGSGSFHFAHLQAGTYFLAVNARPWYAENVPPGQQVPAEFDVAYPITYYGDTTDPNAATPIQLPEGGSAAVQVTLHALPAAHVSISSGEEGEGQQGGGFSAQLYAEGPGGARLPVNAMLSGGPAEMTLTGMAPGRYFVDIQSFKNPGEIEKRFRGEVELATGVKLSPTQTSPISVSGHVAGSDDLHEVMLELSGKDSYYAQIGKDGSFSIDPQNAVAPGSYEVRIRNAPFYVKSVAASGAQVKGQTIHVPDGAKVELSVTVAEAKGTIRGFVVREDKPVSAAMVLLLPLDLTQPDMVRRDQSDSDGSFLLSNIVPGTYHLLAIDDGRDLPYLDAAAMKPYLAGASTVTVTATTDASAKVNALFRNPK